MKNSAHRSQQELAHAMAETLRQLKGNGYELMFRREATCIYCFEWQQWITPAGFTVDESFYFENIANPDADRVLYAISLSRGGKGFLVDACNVYTDNICEELDQLLHAAKTMDAGGFIEAREVKEQAELVQEIF